VDKHFTDDIQTTQYRAPEVIIRSRYGPAVDVWSVACILFELLTGDQLFHPRASKKHSKDDDHGEGKKTLMIITFKRKKKVALIAELLGSWPRDFALGGNRSNDLFTRKGKVSVEGRGKKRNGC
jgi:serine/threonine-protein kinase SRPK3